MKDDIKSLFESSLLTDESKAVLKEAWDTSMDAARTEIEAEYAQRLDDATKTINENAVQMIEETVTEELEALAEELADARSLEVQYANKLQNFKESYAEKTEELVGQMVEEAVGAEMAEIKDDIEYAKKHQFGLKMFESFRDAYAGMFGESDTNIHQQLEEAQSELETLRREKILNGLLESVSGDKRSVIATILDGVATDRLEAKFESLRPIMMKEPVNENTDPAKGEGDGTGEEKPLTEGTVVIDNEPEDGNSNVNSAAIERIRRSLSRIK